MEFMRLGELGAEVPVIRENGRYFRLDTLTTDIDGVFLANEGIERTRTALAVGKLAEFNAPDGVRIGSPIARPMAVLCIGQNYAAHAAESGDAPPEIPILFYKHPNTVVGAYDDVSVPPKASKVDWEIELGVVIGKRARYLASSEA